MAFGLPAAGILAQALALDLEVVRTGRTVGKWPPYWRGPAQAVALQGDYAYVAKRQAGLGIVDIHDPANPKSVGSYDTSGEASGVAVAGNYAYVAVGEAGLLVIDIRDPAYPHWLGRYDTRGEARAVAVAGNCAYVADGYGGLQVVVFASVAEDRFRFLVRGDPGQTVRVQRSQNLTDWRGWQQLTLGDGAADVTDMDFLSVPSRFYRAVSP